MIQGPACVKERERKIATIQNQCRWLRGVESLELQKVARTIGPFLATDMCLKFVPTNHEFFVECIE